MSHCVQEGITAMRPIHGLTGQQKDNVSSHTHVSIVRKWAELKARLKLPPPASTSQASLLKGPIISQDSVTC